MSAVTSSGYGRQDVATFSNQFPRPGGGAVATAQVQGIPQPAAAAPSANGNPTFPWVGLVIMLVLLRVASHLRKE